MANQERSLLSLKALVNQVNAMSKAHAVSKVKDKSYGSCFPFYELELESCSFLDKMSISVFMHHKEAIKRDRGAVYTNFRDVWRAPSVLEVLYDNYLSYEDAYTNTFVSMLREARRAGGMHNLKFGSKEITIKVDNFFDYSVRDSATHKE